MSEVTATFTTPEWNSELNGWCGSCTPMSDLDGDNVWEVSVMMPVGEEIEYKFSADTWNIQEELTPGSSCTMTTGIFTNRVHTALAVDEVLDVVCWESCAACGVVLPEYDLSLTVDMSNYSGAADISALGMRVAGSFNGWDAVVNPMTDNGDGTWSTTVLALTAGVYEWKYVIGDWVEDESLVPGTSCTQTTGGFTNRIIDIQQNETLSVVCYEYCTDCDNIPSFSDVTFNVDMTNELPLTEDVFVFGSFNGWCNDCNVLSDPDGDNVYSTTVTIVDGTYEYKYTIGTTGGTFTDEDLDMVEDAACTIATDDGNGGFFVNRTLTVSGNESLAVHCYASCDACLDPTACVAENFATAPTGLFADQTVAGGFKTQLKWDHYSDASDGCILQGGVTTTLGPGAPYVGAFGQVLMQGAFIAGNAEGFDTSSQLSPNATFPQFNSQTYPTPGGLGALTPGAFYKWRVRCGCIIDVTLPFPAKLDLSNLHLSNWSPYDAFTNLPLAPIANDGTDSPNGFEVGQEKSLNIYPNPNNGQFVVEFYNFDEGQKALTVRNLLGEVVSNSTFLNTTTSFKTPIDVSSLPAGTYLIEVNSGTEVMSKLVMVK
ncbi:MAG: T9SS type A sorting domain-containing protein [Flavobacteriales bacterium]|nr:T9SS type A sorting domain-containing protein [Flavobacteriales bacterium]